ncbi:DUF4097 family beta strand repeat-containing protein [Oscillospiraceae bacterium PP1C4]
MNRKRFRKGILFGIFTAVMISTVSGCGIANHSTNGEYQEKSYTSEKAVNTVVVNSSRIDVVVSSSADDKFHVTCYENDRYKFNISELDDGTLQVKKQDVKKFTVFELPSDLQEITVQVPASFDGELQIVSERAKLSCSSIRAGNIEIESKRGKIELNKVNATGSITINSYRDSISLVDIAVKDEISIVNGRETIYFQNIEFGSNLKIENHRGDITGYLKGAKTDYTLLCEVERGESNLPANLPGGEKNIHIKNSRGDVNVEFDE